MAKTMYKMLEVNTEDGSYKVVYGDDPDGDNIQAAINKFVLEKVHPNDRAKFIKFFYEHYGKMPIEVDKVFYRRLVDGEYRFSVMEAMELNDPIV